MHHQHRPCSPPPPSPPVHCRRKSSVFAAGGRRRASSTSPFPRYGYRNCATDTHRIYAFQEPRALPSGYVLLNGHQHGGGGAGLSEQLEAGFEYVHQTGQKVMQVLFCGNIIRMCFCWELWENLHDCIGYIRATSFISF
ncbi:hypothetical protein QR680_018673 [Steinernema hermaphroditum]|uniref:Uncharacterized protein n=1 Tax=Steinernema hermaphroditum TaxID=289476 RepID=A0AA39LQP9_9BILA|nr:hypothetical protein QR680_018673 [Steinernema hermaphroditum]